VDLRSLLARPSLTALGVLLLGAAVLAQSGTTPAKPALSPPAPSGGDVAAKPDATPKPVLGQAQIRPAIENGLLWLCRHQDADGAWRKKSLVTHCDKATPCASGEAIDGTAYDAGLTGLAVLALLGAGTSASAPLVVHGSKPEVSFDTWACTTRAVGWLMAKHDEHGSASGGRLLYDDCIAAAALCEAYCVGKDWKVHEAARRLLEFVEQSQAGNPHGKSLWGWRYLPKDSKSDTSVTCWAVRAFDSAGRADIRVPKGAAAGALDFVKWVTGSGGLVGYMDPTQSGDKVTGAHDDFKYHLGTMTALAVQVRLLADPKPDAATAAWLKEAVDVLLRDLPAADEPMAIDYYWWYQATEAWDALGSHGFKPLAESGAAWRTALRDALLTLQSAPGEACASGGWLAPDRWSFGGGPVYATAINVLTLEDLAGG
jgi:hypothetical protein